MRCSSCQETLDEHAVVCNHCGKAVNHYLKGEEGQYFYKPIPVKPTTPEYTPIGVWGYVGYSLLFSIPIVGLIALIAFSFNENINVRNYARSHFVLYIIYILLIAFRVFILFL